jgi:Bifunctional DNA primase/polymerase, N-terminal
MKNEQSAYEWAKHFEDKGYSVFPCHENKSPNVPVSWLIPRKLKNEKYPYGSVDFNIYGIVVPKNFLVVDADFYKKGFKNDAIVFLLESLGHPLMTVETGQKGEHYWYKLPEMPHKIAKKDMERYPHIDFLTKGTYAIGPGSKSDFGRYTLLLGDLPSLIPESKPTVHGSI